MAEEMGLPRTLGTGTGIGSGSAFFGATVSEDVPSSNSL